MSYKVKVVRVIVMHVSPFRNGHLDKALDRRTANLT
jgi:hypothetical protein